jgi:hypothetical protein
MNHLKKFNKIKLYVGAMSKICVDSIVDCEEINKSKIGFISSRRQIDYDKGYVNNWTTSEFSNYVKSKNQNLIICRDHGGSGQGKIDDNGVLSYEEDSKNFDLIHVDPWKKYSNYHDGLEKTIEAIKRINKLNNNVYFEVGTEESIRPFSENELSTFLKDLKTRLTNPEFSKIAYCVIQSGVGLDLINQKNTGKFDKKRLKSMIEICNEFRILSKEHNADYLNLEQIKEKFDLGLNAINIAPEIAQIETNVYLENIKTQSSFEKLYSLCLKSNKWKKWVDQNFDLNDKRKLIEVCCHYVFSSDGFLIFSRDVKIEVKTRIQNKILNFLKMCDIIK